MNPLTLPTPDQFTDPSLKFNVRMIQDEDPLAFFNTLGARTKAPKFSGFRSEFSTFQRAWEGFLQPH